MSREVLDEHMIAGLHVVALERGGHHHERSHPHVAAQVGTIAELLDAQYDGTLAVGELLERGDFGVGTVDGLAGELIVLDGEAFLADVDGRVAPVPAEVTTPFAVVCPWQSERTVEVSGERNEVLQAVRELGKEQPVLAIRIEGRFNLVSLRSVQRQVKPYQPLVVAVGEQHEFEEVEVDGTIVGFSFPLALGGVEVSGEHLHFLSRSQERGGHVLDFSLRRGSAAISFVDDLHVEVPAGFTFGKPADAQLSEIRTVEGGR